jgi:hypothetical protein
MTGVVPIMIVSLGWGALVGWGLWSVVTRRRRRIPGFANEGGALFAGDGGAVFADGDISSANDPIGRAWAEVPLLRVFTGRPGRRRQRSAARRVAVELPIVVDLLAIAVGAGYTPALAIELVAAWAPPQVSEPLVALVDRGPATLAVALRRLAADDPPFRPLVDALLVSERTGAPIGPALERLAARLRVDSRRAAEVRARVVPIKLLFPLVFLVLPAFVLLTVVPALALAVRH